MKVRIKTKRLGRQSPPPERSADYSHGVPFRVKLTKEPGGRWHAEVVGLSAVMVYGDTRSAALRSAKALLLYHLGLRVDQGKDVPEAVDKLFEECE